MTHHASMHHLPNPFFSSYECNHCILISQLQSAKLKLGQKIFTDRWRKSKSRIPSNVAWPTRVSQWHNMILTRDLTNVITYQSSVKSQKRSGDPNPALRKSSFLGAQWVQMIWNRRVAYWVIRSSVPSFARTAHSFACSALLASLARSAALSHLITPEL